MLANLRTQLDRSGFFAKGAHSTKELEDIASLREHYGAILASVRQQGGRLATRDTAFHTSSRYLETAWAQLSGSETLLRTVRQELDSSIARIVTLNSRSSTDAAVDQL